MTSFWRQSPFWRRKEELGAALDAATKTRDEAGRLVLTYVRHDAIAPESGHWRECRRAYQDAFEAYEEAFEAWDRACDAFDASPAGQARARFLKDPLADTATESEAA